MPIIVATAKTGVDITVSIYNEGSVPFDITQLDPGSTYVGRVTFRDAAGTITADTTAPVLSSPTGTKDGTDAATGTVSTTKAGGTLYGAVFPGAGSTPSAAQIIAGTGGGIVSADSQAVATTGVQNMAFSGLTASTPYKIAYVHVDEASTPNTSNVVASAQFTTDAEVVELFTDPGFDNAGAWTETFNNGSITGGALVLSGATAGLAYQTVSELAQGTYAYEVDLTGYGGSGSLRFRIWNSGGTQLVQSDHIGGPDGLKTGQVVLGSAGGVRIGLALGSTPITCSIPNISLTPVS